MNRDFLQKITIAFIAGVFVLIAATIQSNNEKQLTVPSVSAISSGGNSSATSNININTVDKRIYASDGSVAIGAIGSNNISVNTNQNSENRSIQK